jgi:anti-anti-sigma factor
MNATIDIFRRERLGETLVLTPRHNLRELEFQEIKAELIPVANDPTVLHVVVDLGQTDYFGSTALGMLTMLCQRVHDRGGRVAFCNLSAHEHEVLELTGLAGLWPVFAGREDALEAAA